MGSTSKSGFWLVLLVLASGVADRPARAVNYTWMGPGNIWSAAGNWAPGTGPPVTPGNTAAINSGPSTTLDVNASIDSFSMNSAAAFLAMQSGTTPTVSGPAMLTQGRISMTSATIAGAGTLTITTKSSVTAQGTSAIQNPISLSGSLTVTDSVAAPTAKLSLAKDLTNNGTIQMTGSQDSSLTLEVNGGKGTLTNAGTMTFGGTNGTPSLVSASVVNNAGGKIVVNSNGAASSSTVLGSDGAKSSNLGSITIAKGATLALVGASFVNDKNGTATGTISGTGTLDRSSIPKGGWTNNGTVKVGTEVAAAGPGSLIPGMLAFVGDYVQSASGELDMEIARPGVAGADYSLLAISRGAAMLDGILGVTVDDPTLISPGDVFTILTTDGGVTGSFANAPEDSNGMSTLATNAGTFTVIYGTDSVELTDFAAAVPEPSALLLMIAGAGVLLTRSRAISRYLTGSGGTRTSRLSK